MITIDTSVLEVLKSYKDKGLRDYQKHNKAEIYNKWEIANTVLLQMPTGTGKTRLFVSIINDLQRYGKSFDKRINVLIITHRKELVQQITNELNNPKYGIDPSLITPEDRYSRNAPKPVCVASIQTLSRRLYQWADYHFDVVVIDEAHHVKGQTYRDVLRTFKESKVLGVTATPYRLNGAGLVREFKELIVSPPIKNFIEAGWLSNYDYYSIEGGNEIYKGLARVPLDKYGDYQVDSLWLYCRKDHIRAQIVGTYLKYARGKKGIVYTINQAHNRQLCEEFQKCGIRAYGIDSRTNPSIREDLVNRFRRGKIDVLCNVNIFTEGFDCPDVEFIQLARPTKSLGLYLQQVGRGLRIAPRKEKVIFLDNVGLHNRFGFPASKRQWGKHYIGLTTDEEKEKYAQEIDCAPPFEFNQRNTDLSEGCETVTLLESTGVNEIIDDAKHQYVEDFAEELKVYVKQIFEVNKQVFDEFITDYSEEHLFIKAEYKEDLLNPCPYYLFKIETDNKKYMLKKIKKEFKPVVNNYGILDYEEYKGWLDYAETKRKMIYSRLKKKLTKENRSNLKKINDYSVSQLRAFFETYYGNDHNMTKKLNSFIEGRYDDPKWKEAQNSYLLSHYFIKTKIGSCYQYDYKE